MAGMIALNNRGGTMFRKFARDRRGNYAMLTALAMLPVMGAVALAVDYSEVSRQRQGAQNALDATNLAIALSYLNGTDESKVSTLAQDYFEANFRPSDTADPTVSVTFPSGTAAGSGGGTLKVCADLKYEPIFYPVVQMLRRDTSDPIINYTICSEVRLKNTLEVALVLDNSGSMNFLSSCIRNDCPQYPDSKDNRLNLLKAAAKELVTMLHKDVGQMQQVVKPVQIGLVPFAASVNVGTGNAYADWMDTKGESSIHHENFAEWKTMSKQPDKDKWVEESGRAYVMRGSGWGEDEGELITRLTLFSQLKAKECTEWNWNGSCRKYGDVAPAWAGCVEMRPNGYDLENKPPTRSDPDTLFVPMFAPDEANDADAYNSWWPDHTDGDALRRQEYMPKYFEANDNSNGKYGLGEGPNASCTTVPLTPLVDVSKDEGLNKITIAIDDMYADGATNVTQGMAWGWYMVSGSEPLTNARPDSEKGNDKVVIVLTDGANTYYTPEYFRKEDLALNKSTYAAYGYAKNSRIFEEMTGSRSYNNSSYSAAMTEQMKTLCSNVKDHNIIVMTVALDLKPSDTEQAKQIKALKECASDSRVHPDKKLFYNTTSGEISETFKEIADELSNLRLVS